MHQDNYERGSSLLSSMVEKSTVILRHLSNNFGEERGYGRFLQNEKITTQDIVECYRPPVPANLSELHVLLVEDTTEVSFGLNSQKTGLSKVGNGFSEGFFAHPVIGIDASNGGCLGLAATEIHLRQVYHPTESEVAIAKRSLEKSAAKKAILRQARETHQMQLPFEDKDRYRWLDTALEASEHYEGALRRTVVADREGDIYQVLMGLQSQGVDFVIRSAHDRYLDATRSETTLHSSAQKWSEECCFKAKLPATDKRSAHEAILQVSYQNVNLACPSA